jgi:DNA-binding NtrC family response regulator
MARILLIEDEPDTSYALTQVLSGAGHDVDEADSAESGLERLADQAYDLMICDLQLAHGQAPALLEAAREAASWTAAVAVSGGGLAGAIEQVRQAKALGAAGVLHKPFESETLLTVVERVLDGAGASRPARRAEDRRAAPAATPSA